MRSIPEGYFQDSEEARGGEVLPKTGRAEPLYEARNKHRIREPVTKLVTGLGETILARRRLAFGNRKLVYEGKCSNTMLGEQSS